MSEHGPGGTPNPNVRDEAWRKDHILDESDRDWHRSFAPTPEEYEEQMRDTDARNKAVAERLALGSPWQQWRRQRAADNQERQDAAREAVLEAARASTREEFADIDVHGENEHGHDDHGEHDHHMPDYGFGRNTQQVQKLLFEAEESRQVGSPGMYNLNHEAVEQVLSDLQKEGIIAKQPCATADQYSDLRAPSARRILDQAKKRSGIGVVGMPKVTAQEFAARRPLATSTGRSVILETYQVTDKGRTALVVRYDRHVDDEKISRYRPTGLTAVTLEKGKAFSGEGDELALTQDLLSMLGQLKINKIKLESSQLPPDVAENFRPLALAQSEPPSKEAQQKARREFMAKRQAADRELLADRKKAQAELAANQEPGVAASVARKSRRENKAAAEADRIRKDNKAMGEANRKTREAYEDELADYDTHRAKQVPPPAVEEAPAEVRPADPDKTGRLEYERRIASQKPGSLDLPPPMDTSAPLIEHSDMPSWNPNPLPAGESVSGPGGVDTAQDSANSPSPEPAPGAVTTGAENVPVTAAATDAGEAQPSEEQVSAPAPIDASPKPGESTDKAEGLSEQKQTAPESATKMPERPAFGRLELYSAGITEKDPRKSASEAVHHNSPEAGLVAVFDGMGEDLGGKEAAMAAVGEIDRLLGGKLTLVDAEARLREAAGEADRAIRGEAAARGAEPGGTTMALMKLLDGGEQAGVMWAGDSRVYRLRGDNLEMLTLDDGPSGSSIDEQRALSSVVSQADIDAYSKAHRGSLLRFNQRRKVTGFLGKEEGSERNGAHVALIDVQPGDRYLLTSAGIHNNLTYEEIKKNLQTSPNPHELALDLTQAARERSQEQPTLRNIRPKLADVSAIALFADEREAEGDAKIEATQAESPPEQTAELPKPPQQEKPGEPPTPKEYSVNPQGLATGEFSRFSKVVMRAGIKVPIASVQLNQVALQKIIEAAETAKDLKALEDEITSRSEMVREDNVKRARAHGRTEAAAKISSAGMSESDKRLLRKVKSHYDVLRDRERLANMKAARIAEARAGGGLPRMSEGTDDDVVTPLQSESKPDAADRQKDGFERMAADLARAERQLSPDGIKEFSAKIAGARTREAIVVLAEQAVAAGLIQSNEDSQDTNTPDKKFAPNAGSASEGLHAVIREAYADVDSYTLLHQYMQELTPDPDSELAKVKQAFTSTSAHEAEFEWTPAAVNAVLSTEPSKQISDSLRTQLVVAGHLIAKEDAVFPDLTFVGEPVRLLPADTVGKAVYPLRPIESTLKPQASEVEANASTPEVAKSVDTQEAANVEEVEADVETIRSAERAQGYEILDAIEALNSDPNVSQADWEQSMSEQVAWAQEPGVNLGRVDPDSKKPFSLESTGTSESDAFIAELGEIFRQDPEDAELNDGEPVEEDTLGEMNPRRPTRNLEQ